LPNAASAAATRIARPEPYSRPVAVDRWAATSQGLRSLRGVCILLLLALHSTLPYMAFQKPAATDFAHPPYAWLAFPILDSRRWLGFDILGAWIDVFLMSLMFFLAGLFASPGLSGKGERAYLVARLARLGAPYLLSLFVLMPIALYPAYLFTGLDPGLTAYARTYLALPFWPSGPMWFLCMLMAMTLVLAALHRYSPGAKALLAHLSSGAAQAPGLYFLGLAGAATLAYVPPALVFSPWGWSNYGPVSFQTSRLLLYFVYFLAGCGVGAHGLADGLLSGAGKLAKHWRLWLVAAPASLFVWMGLTGLSLSFAEGAPLALQLVSDVSYAVASACNVAFLLAAAIRWRGVRSRGLDALSQNAFGIYALHYAPLVWLQYALLDVQAPAVLKAALVFAGTLGVTYAATSAFRWVSRGARAPTGATASG
jgi:hypothetical protein